MKIELINIDDVESDTKEKGCIILYNISTETRVVWKACREGLWAVLVRVFDGVRACACAPDFSVPCSELWHCGRTRTRYSVSS
jgi:hypothetical protein